MPEKPLSDQSNIFGQSLGWKLFSIIGAIGFLILGVYSIIHDFIEGSQNRILYRGLPSILLAAYMLWSSFIYRMILTDEYIERISIRSAKIYFREIKEIQLYEGKAVLKSENAKITITIDIKNYKDIISSVTQKLLDYPHVKVSGDGKDIQRYFKPQS